MMPESMDEEKSRLALKIEKLAREFEDRSKPWLLEDIRLTRCGFITDITGSFNVDVRVSLPQGDCYSSLGLRGEAAKHQSEVLSSRRSRKRLVFPMPEHQAAAATSIKLEAEKRAVRSETTKRDAQIVGGIAIVLGLLLSLWQMRATRRKAGRAGFSRMRSRPWRSRQARP